MFCLFHTALFCLVKLFENGVSEIGITWTVIFVELYTIRYYYEWKKEHQSPISFIEKWYCLFLQKKTDLFTCLNNCFWSAFLYLYCYTDLSWFVHKSYLIEMKIAILIRHLMQYSLPSLLFLWIVFGTLILVSYWIHTLLPKQRG